MLIFDIETNSKNYSDVSIIWCACTYDTDKKESGQYPPEKLQDFYSLLKKTLENGGKIAGHNIVLYDIPVIEKLMGPLPYKHGQVVDTLILSRLIYPSEKGFSHSLAAWGERIGVLKDTEYKEREGAWDAYSEDMLEYCSQDVVVTEALINRFASEDRPSPASLYIEYRIAAVCAEMLKNGMAFDKDGAVALRTKLDTDISTAEKALEDMKIFIKVADIKKNLPKKADPEAFIPYNPGSAVHTRYLIEVMFDYHPKNSMLYKESTDKKTGEKVKRLSTDRATKDFILRDPAAPDRLKEIIKLISDINMMIKIRAAVLNWIDADRNGYIHCSIQPNVAVTGRASHSNPNLAQVPSAKIKAGEWQSEAYGHICRALFRPHDGWIQVGIDLSGLELRCLGHYLSKFDGGDYARECSQGDVHTRNQKAIGLATRDAAKTWVYAYIYGAGDSTLGAKVGGSDRDGARLRSNFMKAIPALKDFQEELQTLIREKGEFKAIDGRNIIVREPYKARNFLIQSCGAIICKLWLIRTMDILKNDFGVSREKALLQMWVHDEQQWRVKDIETAETVIKAAKKAVKLVQKELKIKAELDCEGKVGNSWSDCH